MIITIDNDADVVALQQELNVSRNTIAFLIRAIANHYRAHNEVEIHIRTSLLADTYSYILNPAQLAKNTNVDGCFARARGLTRETASGKYIVIYFTNDPQPEGFWQQALDYVRRGESALFAYEDVPETYQHNPTLLRYRIKQATGTKIRTQKQKHGLKIIVPKI